MSSHAKAIDKCLISIKRGDETQFEKLFDLTYNHLSVVAKYYLRNKSHFEDVVMETYERVLKYIASYREGSDGYNWMCKITENIAFSYNKKFDEPIADEREEGRDDTIWLETSIDIRSFLETRDKESRFIFMNYYYLGSTMEEIAASLHVTKPTISKKLKRIVKDLQNFLKLGNFSP